MIQEEYDVVILGTGPAGLQAAIHAARAKVSVLVMGREHKSSLYKAHVENYCCITGISGQELLQQGVRQASDSGAHFLHEDVIKTSQEDDRFIILTENERNIKTRALIMAMGITRNRLGVPGEKEFLGKGVSYCVDCDANFYKGAKVAVVGGESAAVSGALTLLFYAEEVHLVSNRLQVSDRLDYQIRESDVNIHLGCKVKEIVGLDNVDGLIMDDDQRLNVDGVFIETGAKGAVELAATLGVALDEEKFQYIVTDKQQQTNVPGIYAAGDICGPPWQMAKAVGEGCVAGLSAAKYAKKLRSGSK
ncbi:MAG: NAD(P)/FAD-dependent oxidoreductase [Desulfobacterales bacterium]